MFYTNECNIVPYHRHWSPNRELLYPVCINLAYVNSAEADIDGCNAPMSYSFTLKIFMNMHCQCLLCYSHLGYCDGPVLCNGRILACDWTTHFVTISGKVLTFLLVTRTPL